MTIASTDCLMLLFKHFLTASVTGANDVGDFVEGFRVLCWGDFAVAALTSASFRELSRRYSLRACSRLRNARFVRGSTAVSIQNDSKSVPSRNI